MSAADRPLRIAYLTLHYPPDALGHAARVRDTAETLAGLGAEVTVVAPPPTVPWGGHERQRRRKVMGRQGAVNTVRLWTWAPGRPDPGFAARLLHYVAFSLHAFCWALWNRRSFDVLLAATPPVFVLIPGWFLGALRRRLVTVVDVHDLWVDAAVAMGFISARSPSTRASQAMERACYRRADLLAVTTGAMRDTLVGRGIRPERILVIPNAVDAGRFKPAAAGPGHALPRFVFIGNIGYAQDLETVFQALARIKPDYPRVTFLLTGQGDRRPALEALAAELGLGSSVEFRGVVPEEEMRDLVAASRAGITLLRPMDASHYVVPVKTYHYLAAGTPFLGNHGKEMQEFVEATGGGRLVDNTVEAVADAMRWFLDHPDEAAAMGRRGQAHVLQTYDRTVVGRRLMAAIQGAAEAKLAD